jgi:hypothetical protein
MSIEKEFSINGFEFKAKKWNLPRTLEYQGQIMKILTEPLSTMASVSNGTQDDDIVAGAITAVLLSTIGEIDFPQITKILFYNVTTKNKNGVEVECTLERLDELGVDFDTVILLCADIILFNFGAFIKNDFAGQLTKRMMIEQ